MALEKKNSQFEKFLVMFLELALDSTHADRNRGLENKVLWEGGLSRITNANWVF